MNSQEALSPGAAAIIPVLTLALCLAYQLKRHLFPFMSPGELVIANTDKTDLQVQRRVFSITRKPLFLLLLLTLLLPGNFLDGLSVGKVYPLPQLLLLTLLYYCLYLGTKNFFIRPTFFATAMFVAALSISAALAHGPTSTGGVLSLLFLVMAGLWIATWLIYRRYWLAPPILPLA